jgi:hypothetical protein
MDLREIEQPPTEVELHIVFFACTERLQYRSNNEQNLYKFLIGEERFV